MTPNELQIALQLAKNDYDTAKAIDLASAGKAATAIAHAAKDRVICEIRLKAYLAASYAAAQAQNL
jgi:hypothetical protein